MEPVAALAAKYTSTFVKHTHRLADSSVRAECGCVGVAATML